VSVARFIADQRTKHRVPHTIVCALLGVSLAWFYKWRARATGPAADSGLHTTRDLRRDTVDRAVAVAFRKARGVHGSPRLVHDLRDDGWTVSEKTVAASMRRQGLVARRIRRRNGPTRQDKTKRRSPTRSDATSPPTARTAGGLVISLRSRREPGSLHLGWRNHLRLGRDYYVRVDTNDYSPARGGTPRSTPARSEDGSTSPLT
jgi:putative transposase